MQDISAKPGEPGLAAGDGGGLSVVSNGAGTGAGVRFDARTGVGRTGSGCVMAGAGGRGTYIRSSGVYSSCSSSPSPSSELIPPFVFVFGSGLV